MSSRQQKYRATKGQLAKMTNITRGDCDHLYKMLIGQQGNTTEGHMATLSIASAKGGCGKTTTAILLAAELALNHEYKVALLDSDVNQHASAFGGKAIIKGLTIIPNVDEANVLSTLRKAEVENDVVIIDLPGGSSTLALKAMQRSHFVLVPTQASLPDVRDAIKTTAQIDDAQELARVPIARAILWTRILPGFESKSARHVRTGLEGKGVDILSVALMERAAYREIHITGRVPSQDDPETAAAVNVSAIAKELLTHLEKLSEAA
jgi:chromosome partitioning protein